MPYCSCCNKIVSYPTLTRHRILKGPIYLRASNAARGFAERLNGSFRSTTAASTSAASHDKISTTAGVEVADDYDHNQDMTDGTDSGLASDGDAEMAEEERDGAADQGMQSIRNTWRRPYVEDESDDDEGIEEDPQRADVPMSTDDDDDWHSEPDDTDDDIFNTDLSAFDALAERYEQMIDDIGA
jgi:hypothetical protein